MEMKEQTGSMKKLLAPVAVILLCLVALTGAAYAYSASLEVSDSKLTAQDLTVDLTSGNASTDISAVNAAVTFTDHYKYNGSARQDRVECEIKDILVATVNVTVSGSAGMKDLTVGSSNIEDYYANYFNGVDGTTLGSKIVIKIAIVAANAAAPAIGAATAIADNDDVATLSNVSAGNYKVYIFVDATSNAAFDVRALSDVALSNDKNAAWFKSNFETLHFQLDFTVTEPTA